MKNGIHPREARLAEKQKLDGELTAARTALAKLRCERDGMVIALRKGQLIARYDVKLALGFLLTGMRQRLMSFAYALPRRLVNQSEHAIGRVLDEEMRSALRDVALWPERMTNPNWTSEIDADLMPPLEDAGSANGEGQGAATRRERANAARRVKYAAKSKEG